MLRALCLLLLLSPSCKALDASEDDLLREHLWQQVRRLPPAERPKVGLALSAGSVRGLAHVGVIQVLEDAGFPIDVISGASMGAIVGAVYSAGMPLERLLDFSLSLSKEARSTFNQVRLFRLLLTDSLISSERIEDFIHEQIGQKRFEDLNNPFACVAMDLRTGERVIFREGPLAPAVRASMSLPGIFQPMLYRHRYLVDGGVVDYIPVDLARKLGAQWVLASITENDHTRAQPSNALLALEQVIDIRGSLLSSQQRKEADFAIDVQFGDVNFLDFHRTDEMVENGVVAAKKSLPHAEEAYILRVMPILWRRWLKTGGQ
ncbi:MAG: patatin-like phospholipase family protein [Elusimicrobiota bacterium]|jgi:NTE family protein